MPHLRRRDPPRLAPMLISYDCKSIFPHLPHARAFYPGKDLPARDHHVAHPDGSAPAAPYRAEGLLYGPTMTVEPTITATDDIDAKGGTSPGGDPRRHNNGCGPPETRRMQQRCLLGKGRQYQRRRRHRNGNNSHSVRFRRPDDATKRAPSRWRDLPAG